MPRATFPVTIKIDMKDFGPGLVAASLEACIDALCPAPQLLTNQLEPNPLFRNKVLADHRRTKGQVAQRPVVCKMAAQVALARALERGDWVISAAGNPAQHLHLTMWRLAGAIRLGCKKWTAR